MKVQLLELTISVRLAQLITMKRVQKTNKNLFLPRVNLNYGQFGVKYAAVKTWNETPNEIRARKSVEAFRKKYKDYILSQ